MNILGVHDGHNASAALLVDGKIVKAAQEERFVNIKNEPGMPLNAIRYCLEGIEHLDEVALATFFIHEPDWYRKQDFWEKSSSDYYWNKLTWWLRKRVDPYFRNRLTNRKKLLADILHGLDKTGPGRTGLDRTKGWPHQDIKVVEHHTAHAAAAFYGSHYDPGEAVTIYTADGSGDGLSATISLGTEEGLIWRMRKSTRDESIGEIYSLTTHYLGFRPWEHEYKLMGMAPYSKADSELLGKLFELMYVKDGKFHTKISADFAYDQLKKIYYRKRFDRICATLQHWFEHMMLEWVVGTNHVLDLPQKIACGGGDFMNVKANQVIADQPRIEDMFIFPSAGDESTSIGAAMKVYADWCAKRDMHPKKEITPMGPLYLGPPTAVPVYFENACKARGWECWKEENVDTYIVDMLEEGEIIARCSGRLEFGARALGNRTIMADASNPDVKTPLNSKVKHRDFWMPFAPSVLYEERHRLMEYPTRGGGGRKEIRSPYMIMAFDSTEDGRRELAAAMHPYDYTIRPQIVEREWNPDYWKILNRWHRKSGNGGLLNTSFNVHGRPIVKDSAIAEWTMGETGLEHLVVENWVVRKKS